VTKPKPKEVKPNKYTVAVSKSLAEQLAMSVATLKKPVTRPVMTQASPSSSISSNAALRNMQEQLTIK
jgi:hypothetical protein